MLNSAHEPSLKTKPAIGRTARALRIAVTGFGPFPGMPFNASEALIRDLASHPPRLPPAMRLYPAALPTDWRLALQAVSAMIEALRPHVVLHFGVSRHASGFVIETRAFNQTNPRADCSGKLAQERCVRRCAPAMFQTRLPAARLLQRLRMEGIPAQLSGDAGRYLCNAVMFESLYQAESAGRVPLAGFVHIPALGPETDARSARGLGWGELRRGAAVILDTLARSAQPDQGASRGSGRPCISLR